VGLALLVFALNVLVVGSATEEMIGVEGDGAATDAGAGIGGFHKEKAVVHVAHETVRVAAAIQTRGPAVQPAAAQTPAHASV